MRLQKLPAGRECFLLEKVPTPMERGRSATSTIDGMHRVHCDHCNGRFTLQGLQPIMVALMLKAAWKTIKTKYRPTGYEEDVYELSEIGTSLR